MRMIVNQFKSAGESLLSPTSDAFEMIRKRSWSSSSGLRL
jgi:hypothetical protein